MDKVTKKIKNTFAVDRMTQNMLMEASICIVVPHEK